MKEPQSYDRKKFVAAARKYEGERLAKEEEWNQKNADWIKKHGPIPFQVPKLTFED